MYKRVQQLECNKFYSSSMTCNQGTQPQWISDAQLNYMSQYDFIFYDLDKDEYNLIQKPKTEDHEVISVKYSTSICHKNCRIIYLNKLKQKFTKQKEEKQHRYTYGIMVLPSFNINEPFDNIKIVIPQHQIKIINTFIYLQVKQSIIFPILYNTNIFGIVYKSLTSNKLVYFSFPQQIVNQKNNNQIKSSHKFSQQIQYSNSPLNSPFMFFHSDSQQQIFRESYINLTKQIDQFIFIKGNKIHVFRIELDEKSIQLIDTYQITELNIKKHECKSNQLELYKFIPIHDTVCLNLCKTYIVIKHSVKLLLYYIEESKVCFVSEYNMIINGISEQQSIQLSGSCRGNILLVLLNDKTIIHQYKINEVMNTIEYVTCIDFQSEHGGYINKIILSERGKNVAVLTFNENNKDNKDITEKSSEVINHVTNISIFKIQQYGQLANPQISLCFKKIKYLNYNNKVSRLVLPKINQNLYALTGSSVHNLQSSKLHKLMGVNSFDIHPTGFYMAVSYSFNISIYSLEYNSMTLLYSTSMQNIKKVMYSHEGSMLVMFSWKKIKILNAYSFELKQEIYDKNNSIMDIHFLPKKNALLILYDNGVVLQRSLLDSSKNRNYSAFSNKNQKIVALRIDQLNNNLYLILQNGSLIIKTIKDETITEQFYKYEDQQHISQLSFEQRNNLIFIGTKNGNIRIHNNIQKFSIYQYYQIKVTHSQITAIANSYLQNFVYVGNIIGDITMIKYKFGKNKQKLPTSSLARKKTHEKISPYVNANFFLISGIKFRNTTQLNLLQTKLSHATQRINYHENQIKKQTILFSQMKQKQYFTCEDHKNLYKEFDNKCKKVKNDLLVCKNLFMKNRKDIIQEYENMVMQINKINDDLKKQKQNEEILCQKQKQQLIAIHCKQIKRLELLLIEEMKNTQKFVEEKHIEDSITDIDKLDNFYQISKLQLSKQLNTHLCEQLERQQNRRKQLKRSITFLETGKNWMIQKKINEETLQNRVDQQLNLFYQNKDNQKKKVLMLGKQIWQTENQIQRMQSKVHCRSNTETFSDKINSNFCSYRICIQQQMQNELIQLKQYLKQLECNIDRKSLLLAKQATRLKKTQNLIQQMMNSKEIAKQKLKLKKLQLKYIQNKNSNLLKLREPIDITTNSNKENTSSLLASNMQKIMSIERQNQRIVRSQNMKIKIHTRRYKNMNLNNAQLLNQYQKLKFENKQLLNQQHKLMNQLQKIRQNQRQPTIQEILQKLKSQRTQSHKKLNLNKIKESPFLKYVQNRATITKRACIMGDTKDSTPKTRTTLMTSRRSNSVVKNQC